MNSLDHFSDMATGMFNTHYGPDGDGLFLPFAGSFSHDAALFATIHPALMTEWIEYLAVMLSPAAMCGGLVDEIGVAYTAHADSDIQTKSGVIFDPEGELRLVVVMGDWQGALCSRAWSIRESEGGWLQVDSSVPFEPDLDLLAPIPDVIREVWASGLPQVRPMSLRAAGVLMEVAHDQQVATHYDMVPEDDLRAEFRKLVDNE